MFRTTCYCCGEQYSGGYKKCPNATKAVQEWNIKSSKAGHFQQGQEQDNNSTLNTKETPSIGRKITSKKGNTFTEVKQAEDEEDEEEEEYIQGASPWKWSDFTQHWGC